MPYNVFNILLVTKPEQFKAGDQRTLSLLSFVSQSNFILIALDSQTVLHGNFLQCPQRGQVSLNNKKNTVGPEGLRDPTLENRVRVIICKASNIKVYTLELEIITSSGLLG